MKKLITMGILALMTTTVMAQGSDSYIVKTKGVKKVETPKTDAKQEAGSTTQEAEKPQDFVGRNFPRYGLCDWQDGMRFMVLPEKYDMLVNTFRDESNNKEVSNGYFRRKVMVYRGHAVGSNGRARLNFTCQDDNKQYYFELPNGNYEDYCYNKIGVPTLAYLGDVDIARSLLVGKTLVTTTTDYYVDTDYESDAADLVKVEKGQKVKVVAVGVGTRSFPVKIIVEGKDGSEFFQNVAMSKTNCGMRDDEFIVDNAKHQFYGSFAFEEEDERQQSASLGDYAQYMNKTVHLKYPTTMKVIRNGAGSRVVTMAKETTFRIDGMRPVRNSRYVTLTLSETVTGRLYTKNVTFKNENVTGDIDGQKEDYFEYIFSEGSGKTPVKTHTRRRR